MPQHTADIHQHPAIWVPHRPSRPEKSEGGKRFQLVSEFEPKGDQPNAIKELCEGLSDQERDQVLLGVTGSGKTFTNNAVEYFVSYYDYYQPEAYVPRTDTFIEKDSSVNEQIDRMRHAATRAILERDDCIIVASVSCIYGIGSVETYTEMTIDVAVEQTLDSREFMAQLVALQYQRNDLAFQRGSFRVRGDTVEVFPAHYDDTAWRFDFFGDEIESIMEFDPLTGKSGHKLETARIYANSHYVTPRPTVQAAMKGIKQELSTRLAQFETEGRLLEAQRLQQRTEFDLEMLAAQGFCTGIENYSRYLTGRAPGEPPPTLFEYLPEDALLFTDESHVSVPQIGGMSRGDANRKSTLAEHGFRLPSCIDNRPLKFEEWDAMRPQTVHVSATPGNWEMERTGGVFTEQVIRPTGLIDPPVEVRPVAKDGASQVDDVIDEVRKTTERGFRSLVTTLTKKMAEDLTDYMHEQGIRVRYMHSDIDTLERIDIIRDLRLGAFDVLIGINLLREGLDIPECAFVGILDADKEGFLRSETSLVQTIGRAARNAEARVVLYADKITGSMDRAMSETTRRRERQIAHNEKHGITPQTVLRNVIDVVGDSEAGEEIKANAKRFTESGQLTKRALKELGKTLQAAEGEQAAYEGGPNLQAVLADLEKQMFVAAENLEFEEAAQIRDQIKQLTETVAN